jgi:oxygen-independent coproporphyrinogen-3 oxidase
MKSVKLQCARASDRHVTIDMLGLYVHVPFCAAICNYCNFNRGLFDAAQKARYVDALLAEIAGAPGSPGPGLPGETPRQTAADTIFFGGGTPSLLEPGEIGAVIDACARAFDLAADAEITLEANPETVTEGSLSGYRRAGVNRLSFGVQSFREEELRRLSRVHGVERARQAFAAARAAGFDNISLDLMMWLPGQSVSQWLESVDGAVALAPEHLSLYLLEVYPNAPLRDEMARSRWSQAPDEDAAAMYLEAMERLDRAGYRQYEISNVARPGFESRHNLKYWQDGAWRGFGCGAHSTRAGVRWKNTSATDEYIESQVAGSGKPLTTEVRRLTRREQVGDALFMALRLSKGIQIADIRARYGVDVWQQYGSDLQIFVDAGLLERRPERLFLTRRGMLLAHEVMIVFV